MMACRSIRYAVCVLFLWLTPLAFSRTLEIRLFNAKTGKPIPNQQVTVNFLYGKGETPPHDYQPTVRLQTGPRGTAVFNLPEPAPLYFWIMVRLSSPYWHCACQDLMPTQVAVQKGIAVQTTGKAAKSAGPAEVRPGEILFTARPFTLFERLLYPLVKE
jgi:hypothetical protein